MRDYEVNIHRWSEVFATGCVDGDKLEALSSSSAEDLVCFEESRSHILDNLKLRSGKPVDVFIWALGEPDRRDVTKVGGLPYRPHNKPWPHDMDGLPMTFLAQFRFVESKDLVPRLPGDILLVFTRDDDICTDDPQGRMRFEWYREGETELIRANDVPDPSFDFVVCHGFRHRTIDYLDELHESQFAERLASLGLDDYPPQMISTTLFRWPGTKVGGHPAWPPSDQIVDGGSFPGEFICALSTIIPPPVGPYPWINCADPLTHEDFTDARQRLNIRDGFILNFFLDANENMHWRIAFY